MIPLLVTVFAFAAVAYITKSRTYGVLAFSALANVYIDHFTHADDQYLMVTYSSIEFFTGLAILYYGDIHKLYQTSVLTLMLLAHFLMEYSLVYDKIAVIESGAYIYTISGLIIAQLIGAGRGLNYTHSPYRPYHHRVEDSHTGLFNH